MGKLTNGLFGGFHGKIGNLVGYMLKGKYVIRTIGKSKKPLTPARLANCEKMKVVNEILKPSIHAIRAGFRLALPERIKTNTMKRFLTIRRTPFRASIQTSAWTILKY